MANPLSFCGKSTVSLHHQLQICTECDQNLHGRILSDIQTAYTQTPGFRLSLSRVSMFSKGSAHFPNLFALEEDSDGDVAAHTFNADDRASTSRNGDSPIRYSDSFDYHKHVSRVGGSDDSYDTVIFDQTHLPSVTTGAHSAQRNLLRHFEPQPAFP